MSTVTGTSVASKAAARLNPEKAHPDWPPVVVAGAYQTGVGLMRNLLRRGLRAYAFDCVTSQTGFRSVYGKTFLCPNPDTEPAAWVAFMQQLSRRLGQRPVLIPSADQYVSAISAHAAELQDHFIFLPAASATQALLATKERQYAIAADHGLATARTEYITSAEQLRRFAEGARFPCLIKPDHAREWETLAQGHPLRGQKLALAASPTALLSQYASVATQTPKLVVQEVIEGPDTAKLCYLSCYSRTGERLASCVVRQGRTDPIYFGSASIVEPVDDREADAISDQFLRSIGYSGICELELKRDTRDGQVKLIEANPRYSVTSDAAPYAGVDIGWVHYLDLIGQPVEPVYPTNFNFRHIALRRDVSSFRSYIRAGLLSWGAFFRSYRPPVHFFDFDLHDWRVTWSTMVDVVKLLLYPYVRRIVPKRR